MVDFEKANEDAQRLYAAGNDVVSISLKMELCKFIEKLS